MTLRPMASATEEVQGLVRGARVGRARARNSRGLRDGLGEGAHAGRRRRDAEEFACCVHPFEPVLNNARALSAREATHQRNEVHRQHGEQGVCEPCRAHGEQRREQPLPRHLGVEVPPLYVRRHLRLHARGPPRVRRHPERGPADHARPKQPLSGPSGAFKGPQRFPM